MTTASRRAVVAAVVGLNDRLGVGRALRSLDYFRCLEYALAVEHLAPRSGMTLLDMGCGRGPFSAYLSSLGPDVWAMDLDSAAVAWQRGAARRLNLSRLRAFRADSRRLACADASFDLVLNLSSIEHIRDRGDVLASAEIGRVLRPGGRAVLTVPFGPELVERRGQPHTATFERRYDTAALDERLVDSSGLTETARVFFGEPGWAFSRLWYGLPAVVRLPVRRLAPAVAARFLQPLPGPEGACGVCLVLTKS